jgi:hypothetical protein
LPEPAWEVAIWHGFKSEWEELALQGQPSHLAAMEAGQTSTTPNLRRYTFSGQLEVPGWGKHALFTVKYRVDRVQPWQWANQQLGTKDGELIFAPIDGPRTRTFDTPELLSKYIDGLNPELEVESRLSESPGAILWGVRGSIGSANEDSSTVDNILFGRPTDFIRNFLLVRHGSPWLAPRHGTNVFHLAEDAILLSFLRRDGMHLVMLAISGVGSVLTTFRSQGENEVAISARNDDFHQASFEVLVAVAPSFDIASAAVMYEARKVMRQFNIEKFPAGNHSPASIMVAEHKGSNGVKDGVRAQWLYNWFDGLGYCTWNALGRDLTEEKILHALDSLRSCGIGIRYLIIDDNWQSLDNSGKSQFERGWTKFEANEKGFPNGLERMVAQIRQNNPDIEHIGVWHALMGYWGGISPNGEIASNYKTKTVKKVGGGTITAVDPDDVHRLYDDFYSFLVSSGIDSVKTDAQFFLDLLDDPTDRVRFTKGYQDAWSISSLRHFQDKVVSCMSLVPQIIFHSQVPTNRPPVVLRNSDDFFPEVPSSHPWHIFCNAHVSLLTRHLNVVPDWDMFQTDHPYASFHAAGRCMSGGPVYITDEPGRHDLELIDQMTAPTVQGKTIILRPTTLGRTMDVYNDYNESHILKVGAYNGWARTGSGMLGLFNIAGGESSCLVSLVDFPGVPVDSDLEYVVYAHNAKALSRPSNPADRAAMVSVCLEPKGWEILTAIPVQSFSLPASEDGIRIAVLGLLGKMTGVTGIISSHISVLPTGRLRMDITLRAIGTLGIYISNLESKTVESNFIVMVTGRAVPVHTVQKKALGGPGSTGYTEVLAIDVLAAWKEMGLNSGWGNEVTVQVVML